MSDAAVETDRSAEGHRRLKRIRRTLGVVLAVLVVLLLLAFVFLLRIFQPVGQVANSKEARGIEWVRSIYGWGNARAQQLSAPGNVAFGPDGRVWVTDPGQRRVVAFQPDGSYSAMLRLTSSETTTDRFSFPSSVAVDEQGLVYVGDMTGSMVFVMAPDGRVVRKIPAPRPHSIAVRDGRMVVGANPGFAILTTSGDVLKVIGSQGKGDGQFNVVSGVAIGKNGDIFVLDEYNNRVSAYDRDGKRKWIRATGTPGNQLAPKETMSSKTTTAQAQMQLPSGIAIDGAGRLVIVDAFGFNVVVLNAANGDLVDTYGDAGTEDGKFIYPSGITYDAGHDYFAVADTAMSRVQIVRMPGSGGTVLATVKRSLLGPARACLFPLALLVIVTVCGVIYRNLRRRAPMPGPGEEGTPDIEEAV